MAARRKVLSVDRAAACADADAVERLGDGRVDDGANGRGRLQ